MQSLKLLLLLACVSLGNVIRYEAENAHSMGSFRHLQNWRASGKTFVNYMTIGDRVIFTVNMPQDGTYDVNFHYLPIESNSIFRIRPNGYDFGSIEFAKNQQFQTMSVLFRQGVNILIMDKQDSVEIGLDCIEVVGAIPLAERGATVPYEEIEAESASFSGNIIGPDRTYMNLPSEASGRRAVQLNLNQYVEFTTTADCNAIVVRFSIPDSADGNGQSGLLQVSVNGLPQLNITLTSKFSWTYGAYPFTNNPGDGSAHHFFDDARAMFKSTVSSGSKVRLTPVQGNFIFTIDLADFYVVPGPYSMPNNFLDIVAVYGADPTGQQDSTLAFQKAIADGSNQGKGVWIPQGTFLTNQLLTVNKVTIRGAGQWYSNVVASVAHGVGFFGTWAPNPSVNVELYDFAMFGDTVYRDDNVADSGTGGSLQNSICQNLWIEHTKCGMWLDGPFDSLHITANTLKNTWADGINFHKGITNCVVEQSVIRNTGDDGLAMWSDTNADAKNIFQFNTIQLPVLANGIAIYGGESNSATDNYVADTICEGAGLQVGNRFSSVPLSGTTTFARNTVIRCGAPNRYNSNHNGAIWVWPEQAPMNTPLTFSDIVISDSSFAGMTFWGLSLSNCSFTNVNITTAPYAAEVNSIQGSADFTYTVATGLTNGGIQSCDGGFTFNQGTGCSGWSDSHCG